MVFLCRERRRAKDSQRQTVDHSYEAEGGLVARDGPAPVDLVDAKELPSRSQWPIPAVVLALTELHLSVRLLGHLETCIDEVVQNPVR